MFQIKRSIVPFAMAISVSFALTGLGVACSSGDNTSDGAASAEATVSSPASDLRLALHAVLAEHVSLAASATGAALDGQDAEFKAAAAALDTNSVDLAKLVGSAYGPSAETAFLEGWRRHIGFFVDYTVGSATNDQAKRDKAVADLEQYAIEVSELFSAANGLPKDDLVKLVEGHILGLTSVIDAQATGNDELAYTRLRESVEHMQHFSDPLAEATVKKFPEKFKG